MTYVVRSYRGPRLLARIGVRDAQDARRWAASMLSDPEYLPDRVTVWRTFQDRSAEVAQVNLSFTDDFKYFDGITMIGSNPGE